MDGILVVNKPRGLTSHDVVGRVRRLAQQQRVGHAGTLDPMATGVLLVCLGRATRLAEYLMDSPKTYRAVLRLGVETDTYDAEGQIVAQRPVAAGEPELRAALARFAGEIEQVPPMYSALKRSGQPLYKLARRGLEVERAPRRVTIYAMALRAWQPPEATVEVRCSPGTYIRSLAHDVGALLGCGAHLVELTRLASGAFTLESAVALPDLRGLADLKDLLRPLEAALQNMPALTLDADAARRVLRGQAIPAEPANTPAGALVRAHDARGRLLAILSFAPEQQAWQPHKVLAETPAEHDAPKSL